MVTIVRVKKLGSNRQEIYFKMNLQIDLERSAGPRSHRLQRPRNSRRESRDNMLFREPEFDVLPCRALKPSDGQLNVKHGNREMSGASRRILDVFRIPHQRDFNLPHRTATGRCPSLASERLVIYRLHGTLESQLLFLVENCLQGASKVLVGSNTHL